jgi:hypothetical protein
MASGSDGDGLTTKPDLQMLRVGAQIVRGPVACDTIGAHQDRLDSTHEGFGLHDELPVTGTENDVGFHGVTSQVAQMLSVNADGAKECCEG